MSQPLKRFTQCGSLTMLFAVFIVLFGVSSTALTTFGKSNTQNQVTQAPVIAKNCVGPADCASEKGTSCVLSNAQGEKGQKKCLCGDNKAPPTTGCTKNSNKGLRHSCTDNGQCGAGLICLSENIKNKSSFGSSSYQTNNYGKLCLCDEDEGYIENKEYNFCSGAIQVVTGVLLPLGSLFMGYVVSRRS